MTKVEAAVYPYAFLVYLCVLLGAHRPIALDGDPFALQCAVSGGEEVVVLEMYSTFALCRRATAWWFSGMAGQSGGVGSCRRQEGRKNADEGAACAIWAIDVTVPVRWGLAWHGLHVALCTKPWTSTCTRTACDVFAAHRQGARPVAGSGRLDAGLASAASSRLSDGQPAPFCSCVARDRRSWPIRRWDWLLGLWLVSRRARVWRTSRPYRVVLQGAPTSP